MAQNILITGAAGYIGGSLLADLRSRDDGTFKSAKLFAAVRAPEQVEKISALGVQAIQVDLNDKEAVEETVLQNKIDIVVHTAGAVFPAMVSNFISALGKRRQDSGNETYFIHSSIATMFTAEGGWPFGEVKDTDSILDKEKELGRENPVRNVNVLVNEEGKAQNVNTLIVAVPMVYGRGTGEYRKLSVNIPAFIRTSIKLKTAYKFDKDASPPTLHISDLTALYALLVGRILKNEPVATGEDGYYFAVVHRSPWWKVMQSITEDLYSRGLVTEPTLKVWPNYDVAADTLGFPRLYIKGIAMSNGDLVPVKAHEYGWKPRWNEDMFLVSLKNEVDAVQELDTVKPTLFSSLISESKS